MATYLSVKIFYVNSVNHSQVKPFWSEIAWSYTIVITHNFIHQRTADTTSCAARWPPQYAPAPADRRVSLCGLWARTAHLCTEFEGHSFIRDDDMTYFDSEH